MIVLEGKKYYVSKPDFICPCGDIGEGSLLKASEPDYKSVITDANLRRRMGHLLKMAVYCGLKSMENMPSDEIAGIITFTGYGFLRDTVIMSDNIIDRNEEMLNPSPFMQSTFNTASGYLAQIKKTHAYNTTYADRANGMYASMTDAIMIIDENPGKSVLVGGFDEALPETDLLRKRLGLYVTEKDGCLPLGEGSGFFCISEKKDLTESARLVGMTEASEDIPAFLSECLPYGNASVFNDIKVFKCSSLVHETGAFMSMLSVALCKALQGICSGYVLVIDDVNKDGSMLLLDFSDR